ncbi:holin [Amycolatopsis minnesotensis]|uniref:Holin n=1 Tax=Amycolatopsis minnesotensis TaxID=337894 RepID=A0ABN2RJC6_9PSEU
MFSAAFWKDAIERAVKSFAGALAAWLATAGTGLLAVDWPTGLSLAGFAAVASVLTSITSAPFGTPSTASVIRPPQGAGLRARDNAGVALDGQRP